MSDGENRSESSLPYKALMGRAYAAEEAGLALVDDLADTIIAL